MPSQAARLGPIARSLQKQCLTCSVKADRLCSRCLNAHYCSRECQKANWPTHKPMCNHGRAIKDRQEEIGAQLEAIGWEGISPSEGGEMLRKWCQVYEPFIDMAVLDVFQVRGPPDLHMESMIVIDLKPTFVTRSEAHSIPISRRFLVEDARLVKIEEFRTDDAYESFGTSFDKSIEHSKEIRAKGGVGTGMALAAVSVKVNGIMNLTQMNAFTATGVTGQQDWTDFRDGFPVEVNWLYALKIAVAQGRCL